MKSFFLPVFDDLFTSRPPPEPPAEETLGMPVLGAAGGVALDEDNKEEDRNLDPAKDEEEDSWQDSSACSPLPGDPAPLALVKTKVEIPRSIFTLF